MKRELLHLWGGSCEWCKRRVEVTLSTSTCSSQRRTDVATKAGTIKEQLTQKEGLKTDLQHCFRSSNYLGRCKERATPLFSFPRSSACCCCLFQTFCICLIMNSLWIRCVIGSWETHSYPVEWGSPFCFKMNSNAQIYVSSWDQKWEPS